MLYEFLFNFSAARPIKVLGANYDTPPNSHLMVAASGTVRLYEKRQFFVLRNRPLEPGYGHFETIVTIW